jgi:hypothetical protein
MFLQIQDIYNAEKMMPPDRLTHNLNKNEKQRKEIIDRATLNQVDEQGYTTTIFDTIQ